MTLAAAAGARWWQFAECKIKPWPSSMAISRRLLEARDGGRLAA